jgi:hypothetical protein
VEKTQFHSRDRRLAAKRYTQLFHNNMEEKEQLIAQLTQMLNKPGGKQAARFFLNSLGAIPFVGGVIAASGNIWGEKDQQHFNEKLVEWIESTNADLEKALNALEKELKEPNVSNLSILLAESLGVEIPSMVREGVTPTVFVILHPQTIQEFEPFQEAGLITMKSNGSIATMGAGNRIGNSIEDKKRPWGIGNGFIIQLNEAIYNKQ